MHHAFSRMVERPASFEVIIDQSVPVHARQRRDANLGINNRFIARISLAPVGVDSLVT